MIYAQTNLNYNKFFAMICALVVTIIYINDGDSRPQYINYNNYLLKKPI